MFVINPDPYSLPCYRIGPFQTKDLSVNHNLPESNLIEDYFNSRFEGKEYIYTYNGRSAIHHALEYYRLQRNDVVTILTTTGNFYISGCVTNEIEKYCKWSREILAETRLIFVNHEFGFPYQNLSALKKYGLPIIEDCAGSFFSSDEKSETGKIGDFVIYSFPKMFPLQIGGLLVANFNTKDKIEPKLGRGTLRYIMNVLSEYIVRKDQIIEQRLFNYHFLKSEFNKLGLDSRFSIVPGSVPGVFMFRTENSQLNLPELKNHYYAHGIQCSVFYGEEAFFLPVHQSLNEEDMLYFTEVMKDFISKTIIKES
jgi:hypothetical protein